ncbi:MAG: hypothetical protein HYU30_05595 [Chloroflexi bacterium]|nr:hypothetical protein [Chloroflexota bacterium]
MQKRNSLLFSPEIPPDLEHAAQVREEALDWLETHYPGALSFTTGEVLRMAGESGHRWLITRLRARDIGNDEEFSLPAAADALTVLFLRSRGVKFREAVDAVVGGKQAPRSLEPRYGGVWNRLIVIGLKRLRRRVTTRLLGSAVAALLRDPKDHPNCLIIVKRLGKGADVGASSKANAASHEHVYRTVLERPAPSCWVISPFREVLYLDEDQLPTRSEVTSRQFVGLQVKTAREVYELLLGAMRPLSVVLDNAALEFVGKILDAVFLDFEEFYRRQSVSKFEAATEPEPSSADDLQLWLMSQLLAGIYPGSLCELSESSQFSPLTRVLANSAARPWEPSPWEPAKSLEMLSGYASRVGVPLVVEKVEPPWMSVVEFVESELRYLRTTATEDRGAAEFSALALPIASSSGNPIGSLYMLLPRLQGPRMDVEVRILTVFSRIIGEIMERQRAAIHSAIVSATAVSHAILKPEQFKTALLELLRQSTGELQENGHAQPDVRLPFILLSAYCPEPDELDPATSGRLKDWLIDTLHHLEWRSFVRSHLPGAPEEYGAQGFIGEVPGVGMMVALGRLVSKDELDRIRNAFPTNFNRITPTNSPVKLVAWVLDVPAQQILDAADHHDLPGLADRVERWAFDVASLVDDIAQSSSLAHEQGEWDAALRRIRKAFQKEGARSNSYLRRLAADCSFALGDWPSALKYAQEAATLSKYELGSGLVRSLCQEGDAHLCLCQPVRAWDLYSDAASQAPTHPLPRYYRGQALLLMARLLDVYEGERRRSAQLDAGEVDQIRAVLNTLVSGAMEDLTAAADLLDRWGLIPESYQYRNFNLVPTLLGQGFAYLLARSPGPAASRLQSARRSFPKDDLFFREFLFAKCWEQGLHRRYGELLLGDEWGPLRDRLNGTFGQLHIS